MDTTKLSSIKLSEAAHWDEEQRQFHVLLIGSDEFGALIIKDDAPLPLDHLNMREHRQITPLGANLHDRLEGEVRSAISRGAHQVATGLSLLTHAELAAANP